MVATVIDVIQVSFSFPMEMHLVHIAHTLDKENKSATDPDNVPDGLAVLGFLFEVGEQCIGQWPPREPESSSNYLDRVEMGFWVVTLVQSKKSIFEI